MHSFHTLMCPAPVCFKGLVWSTEILGRVHICTIGHHLTTPVLAKSVTGVKRSPWETRFEKSTKNNSAVFAFSDAAQLRDTSLWPKQWSEPPASMWMPQSPLTDDTNKTERRQERKRDVSIIAVTVSLPPKPAAVRIHQYFTNYDSCMFVGIAKSGTTLF